MARRDAGDWYEFSPFAEEIIPHDVILKHIRIRGLERFTPDILQEVVARLLTAQRKGKELNIAYGFKTLRSVLNDMYEKTKKRRKLVDNYYQERIEKAHIHEHEDPLKRVSDRDMIEKALPTIRNLELRDFTILQAKLLENYTFKRIAKIVGCKESTVRVRYNKIITRLRACVKDNDK